MFCLRRLFFFLGPLWLYAAVIASYAHPLGRFGIHRLAILTASPAGVEIEYIADLAELPARDWKMLPCPQAAAKLVDSMKATGPLALRNATCTPVGEDLRIVLSLQAQAHPGVFEYEDRNFLGRSGWREIVVRAGPGVHLVRTSHPPEGPSNGLTRFSGAPPEDWKARMEFASGPGTLPAQVIPLDQSQPATAGSGPVTQDNSSPAAPPRRDYLQQVLHEKELSPGLIAMALLTAVAFGALHAVEPGHGKTLVAAYLVGSRGTWRDALTLGAMVTFTHTVSVFLLGLATLFLSQYVMPDRIIPVLSVLSGLLIVVLGVWLVWKRWHELRGHEHTHSHSHAGGHAHSHDISSGGLMALGVSGGLVPCPTALVLLLSAIALGRIGFGIVLLAAFSLGLAGVLIGIGFAVLYARRFFGRDRNQTRHHMLLHYLPLISACIVTLLGLAITAAAMGWIRPLE